MARMSKVKDIVLLLLLAFLISIPLCWIPLIVTVEAFGYFLGQVPLVVVLKMCLLSSAVFEVVFIVIMWDLVSAGV